jgi:hypothetical protein
MKRFFEILAIVAVVLLLIWVLFGASILRGVFGDFVHGS